MKMLTSKISKRWKLAHFLIRLKDQHRGGLSTQPEPCWIALCILYLEIDSLARSLNLHLYHSILPLALKKSRPKYRPGVFPNQIAASASSRAFYRFQFANEVIGSAAVFAGSRNCIVRM